MSFGIPKYRKCLETAKVVKFIEYQKCLEAGIKNNKIPWSFYSLTPRFVQLSLEGTWSNISPKVSWRCSDIQYGQYCVSSPVLKALQKCSSQRKCDKYELGRVCTIYPLGLLSPNSILNQLRIVRVPFPTRKDILNVHKTFYWVLLFNSLQLVCYKCASCVC